VYPVPEGREGPEGPLAAARALAGAALAALEASRARIDDLNVYPVPDGDTGTNMTLTVRAVRDTLDSSTAVTAEEVAADLTRAALMGARGNSGVILSQLVGGAVGELGAAQTVDAAIVARALRAASDAGYAAVREPQEGTILTVCRELAERAESPGDVSLAELLSDLVAHGEGALARTQEQLPILREAGVVDAGGAGLLEIVRGIAAHVRGEPLPQAPAGPGPIPVEAVHLEPSRFRYCTSFFVEGDGVEPDGFERQLEPLGDSLLVVGGPGAVKVHLHTDEPGRALALATAAGVVEEIDIKNMHRQTAEREERLAPVAGVSAVVAVAAGEGNARLFRSLGAEVVDGGRTMNPPTSEILAGIEAATAGEVIVLPNNPNVLLAAEQAAAAASRAALVVPTRTMQAGLGALVAFDPARPAAENMADMAEAAAGVRSGAVARASRTTSVDGIDVTEGSYFGLVDGTAVAAGDDLGAVARDVATRLADGACILTILVGEDGPDGEALAADLASAHPGLEIEVHDGGQPSYPLLLAAE
jgi:DAK2 domain fusion protein YloV